MKSKEGKKPKEETKNFSLRLAKSKHKALKLMAVERDTSVQKLIESLVDDLLESQS